MLDNVGQNLVISNDDNLFLLLLISAFFTKNITYHYIYYRISLQLFIDYGTWLLKHQQENHFKL